MAEELGKKFQQELGVMKAIRKEEMNAINTRQQLTSQMTENTFVKQEMDLLKPGAEVFKLIGPVLVKIDLVEAKQNVSKRMEYIGKEIERNEELLKSINQKLRDQAMLLRKLETQFEQVQKVPAAVK